MRGTSSLPGALAVLQSGADSGIFYLGAQLYVSVGSEQVVDEAVGLARPTSAATELHVFPVLCATKPMVALATLRLADRGILELDRPLGSYVGAWSGAPIGSVTARQVLSHRAGLPATMAVPSPFADHASAVEGLKGLVVKFPRSGVRYAPTWGYLAVGVVLRELGIETQDVIRDEVLEPLEISDCWLPIKPDELNAVRDRMGINWLHTRDVLRPYPAEGLEAGRYADLAIGGYATAKALGRFYEAVLNRQVVERGVISESNYETMLAPVEPDAANPAVGDAGVFSPGFMLDLAKHGFGDSCSPSSFGHSGGTGQIFGFADPLQGLVVACIIPTIEIGDASALIVSRRAHLVQSIRRELGLSGA